MVALFVVFIIAREKPRVMQQYQTARLLSLAKVRGESSGYMN